VVPTASSRASVRCNPCFEFSKNRINRQACTARPALSFDGAGGGGGGHGGVARVLWAIQGYTILLSLRSPLPSNVQVEACLCARMARISTILQPAPYSAMDVSGAARGSSAPNHCPMKVS
jgi:hypothetical protein